MQLVEARMQRSCKLLSLSKLGRRALGASGREDEPVCHPGHVFWVQDRIFFLVSTAHVVVARYPVEYEVLRTTVSYGWLPYFYLSMTELGLVANDYIESSSFYQSTVRQT